MLVFVPVLFNEMGSSAFNSPVNQKSERFVPANLGLGQRSFGKNNPGEYQGRVPCQLVKLKGRNGIYLFFHPVSEKVLKI
jgi:hypothetical protein